MHSSSSSACSLRTVGHPVDVREHGVLGEGLPQLPSGALGQLRLNGYITVAKAGSRLRIGVGSRTRTIAAHWKIEMPPDSAAAEII